MSLRHSLDSELPAPLLDVLCDVSSVLNAGLDRCTIQILYRLINKFGLDSETIAALILTLREESEKLLKKPHTSHVEKSSADGN